MIAPPIVNVDTIPEEGLTLTVDFDSAWLSEVLEDTEVSVPTQGDGVVKPSARVRLDVDGRNVLLTGEFTLDLTAHCVACLDPFAMRLAAPFTLHLSPEAPAINVVHRGKGPPPEVELTADDLDADTYRDGRIELGPWLREQILLEVPLHPRHEGDCPNSEVPPASSFSMPLDEAPQPPGLDPRLAPLLSFVSKTKKE